MYEAVKAVYFKERLDVSVFTPIYLKLKTTCQAFDRGPSYFRKDPLVPTVIPAGVELIARYVTNHNEANEQFEVHYNGRPVVLYGSDLERVYTLEFPRLNDSDYDDIKKVRRLALEHRIRICWNHNPESPKTRGWMQHESIGRCIWLDWFKADIFTVIHEVGHVLLGPMCCDAHEELAVYQFMRAAHLALKINTPLGNRGRDYRDQFILDSMFCERRAARVKATQVTVDDEDPEAIAFSISPE